MAKPCECFLFCFCFGTAWGAIIDIREYIDCSLAQPTGLVLVELLAVEPESDVKENFYCTVYYLTVNSNCGAQRASKNK
jgi:hypothetical protein